MGEDFRSSSLPPEILAEIKKLHFHTRKLADQGIRGSYRSAFRGHGIEFEEVREYTPGDDVRSIDWKVTARSQKPFVKSYREERELTVMLAVDISASTHTATRTQLREKLIASVGAILSFIALANNDKVGLVTFGTEIEKYFPPRKARSAVWRILHEVLSHSVINPTARKAKPSSTGTDLNGLLTFLNRTLNRRAIVFILSDFVAPDYEAPLAVLAKRHDVTAIVVRDACDIELPNSGLVVVKNPETGAITTLDTGSKLLRDSYSKLALAAHNSTREMFFRRNVDLIELRTDEDFLHKLKFYFRNKERSTRARRERISA